MIRHQLFELIGALPRDSAERKAAAAAVCPTSLYQTRERIPHGFHFVRKNQVCRNKVVCPHCYARLMTDQFRTAAQFVKNDPPEFLALFSRSNLVDLGGNERFHQHQLWMRKELVSVAKSAGGTGGIWTQQIAPALNSVSHGAGDEVSFSELETLELRIAVMAVIPATRLSLERILDFPSKRKLIEELTEIDFQRFDAKRSLRSFFLKGRDISKTPTSLKENCHGLFYWPPVSICTPAQWVARYHLMRNQPVSRRWGTWSKQNSNKHSSDQVTPKTTLPTQQQRRIKLLRSAEPRVRQRADSPVLQEEDSIPTRSAGFGCESADHADRPETRLVDLFDDW